MELDRPEPGVPLNAGAPTIPRPAATVILVRGDATGLEVLLVQRNPAARLMGGVWVFPGGSVEPHEGEGERGLRAAAARELHEEAGIALGSTSELLPFARWITPRQLLVRFDTWFYVANAPVGAEPRVDGVEVVAHRWLAPAAALEEGRGGALELVFPTIKQLERLAGFSSAADLLEEIRSHEVVAVEPRVIDAGGRVRIVLPGEPGYDADSVSG
jgi:8-oxo-dGTP pyrophosphatase MutT (NUDIX family)